MDEQRSSHQDKDEFVRRAGEPAPGLAREFWDFLRQEKKWWLAPIILVLLAVTAVAVLSAMAGPGAMPFIYTLF